LKQQVQINNSSDTRGPSMITKTTLLDLDGNITEWRKIQSLGSSQEHYFYNTEWKRSFKKNSEKLPKEVLSFKDGAQWEDVENCKWPARPAIHPESLKGQKQVQVMTNSYEIKNMDKLDKLRVFIYTVNFDPPIEATEKMQRRIEVFGNGQERKKRLRDFDQHFGHWEYNNQVLHSLNRVAPPMKSFPSSSGNHKINIILASESSLYALDNETTRSAFLSLFVRRKLDDADYCRLYNKSSVYYPRAKTGPFAELPQKSRDWHCLVGFDASVGFSAGKTAAITADCVMKAIRKESIGQMIQRVHSQQRGNEENFRKQVKRLIEGKNCITMYSKQTVRIDKVDFSQNHNTQIPGMEKTYKSYLKDRYGHSSPNNEFCILINVDRRTERESGFLPQHCYLQFENEDEQIQAQVKEVACEKLQTRFRRIDTFIDDCNETRKRKKPKDWRDLVKLEFTSKGIPAKGIQLPQPGIRFFSGQRGARGRKVELDYIYNQNNRDEQISWSTSKGPLNSKKMRGWKILLLQADKNRRCQQFKGGMVPVTDYIMGEYKGYARSRQLSPDVFPPPTFAYIQNMNLGSLDKLQKYQALVGPNDQVIFGLLPEGPMKSQMKQEMTRAFSLKNSRVPRETQFIDIEKVSEKHRMKTLFDMVLLKHGNIMYELIPKQRTKLFNFKSMWLIGICVDVNPDNGHWPIACVTLQTDALEGSLDCVIPCAHLMDEKKRIIPYEAMRKLIQNVCKRAFEKTKTLPDQVVVFRDGISDGQFPELYSKEITGLKKAINTDLSKLVKKTKWKPKILFLVVQKGILHRFGIQNQRRGGIDEIMNPVVVFEGPLSRKYWDFLLQVTCNRVGGCKPSRYVVLFENIGLKTDSVGWLDMFNFIHALHYGYAPMVPWPNGPSAIVGPLKHAAHYAQNLHEHMRTKDMKPSDLSAHPSLTWRCQVLDNFKVVKTKETKV